MIAALYVQRGGIYWDLPDVDPWDEARDARLYAGPWPVVAHPPCARWCRLAGLVWLYAVRCDLPSLRWGTVPVQDSRAWVSWCGNATRGSVRSRLGKSEASATPLEFRDILIAMARSSTVMVP